MGKKMIYTGITIGPIYRCMEMARSTKAIWSASYLFSYIMKSFYQSLKNNGVENEILLPRIEKDEDLNKSFKMGLFPDRLIIKGEIDDFKDIKNDIIQDLAQKIANVDIKSNVNDVKGYLDELLVINKVEKEFQQGDSVILIMNQLLDTCELQNKTQNKYADEDFLKTFFEYVGPGINGRICTYNAFIEKEFKDQLRNSNPFQSFENLTNSEDRYLAVIQADGDYFGKFICDLDDDCNIKKVSKCLFSYSKIFSTSKCDKLLIDDKIMFVYAGGDDLLFFSPIDSGKCNLLKLTQDIDKCFDEHIINNVNIKDLIQKEPQPSVSYGIHIFHCKYPMDQALETVKDLLFNKAKAGEKNSIALRITKHSGRVMECTFNKEIRDKFIPQKSNTLEKDESFISSFIHKLDSLSKVIETIGLIEQENERTQRFDAFFENFFDEEIHQDNNFLNKVKELIKDIYHTYPLKVKDKKDEKDAKNIEEQNKKNLNLLYTVLRFYQLIK